MKTKLALTLYVCLLTSLGAAVALASGGNWPQWRGPDRTDVSKETGLLKEWPAGGPKRVWLFKDAGLGYAGPSIVGGKLFTMGERNNGEELIAVDVKEGKELWAAKMGEALKNDYGDGPRGTPAVDGDSVYGLSGRGDLVCANVTDGKVMWRHTMTQFGGRRPGWGYTESVLVDGDKVVCTPGGSKGAIIALNKKTGETIWQSKDFTDEAHYASIIAADYNNVRQYIQLTSQHVVGLNAADGKVLWTSDWPGRTAVIPTPIFYDGYVYVTAGYGVGCKLVKLGANNEATEIYFNKEMVNHHGGVVLVDGYIYGYSDSGGWTCQNFKTSEKVWTERKALSKGAVTCAEGMLYCLGENDGTVALVEASPKGWTEHGRFKLEAQTTQRSPRGKVWTHPVVTDGRLYLRDQEFLSCYDVKAP
jgi:outer membrane protein assembly factor BamB